MARSLTRGAALAKRRLASTLAAGHRYGQCVCGGSHFADDMAAMTRLANAAHIAPSD